MDSIHTEPYKSRFLSKINFGASGECWEWTAGGPCGYGSMSVGGRKVPMLAEEYGMSLSAIRSVVDGTNWRGM